MKAVVAGWFSYAGGHATAGDLLARDLLCEWLNEWGIDHEVAVAPPFRDGIALEALDPTTFTHAFFVCGPFGRKPLEADFLLRFSNCRLIGLSLSFETDPAEWLPFDFHIERDSTATANPDIVFASRQPLPPVVGICLVEPHPGAEVACADAAIAALLDRHHAARVTIDTRLDVRNDAGLRTPGEVEALIARCDMLVTTRLHGLVMALKNGVPVIAIDTVPGGGKLARQCERVGWPNFLGIEELRDDRLDAAYRFACSAEARALAQNCGSQSARDVAGLRHRLREALEPGGAVETSFAQRIAPDALAAYRARLPAPPGTEPVHSGRLRRLLGRARFQGTRGR